MSTLHQEHHFESAICNHLGQQGWLYAEGDAAHYDRQNALFLPDLLTWIETTQPESWQQLSKTHGAGPADNVGAEPEAGGAALVVGAARADAPGEQRFVVVTKSPLTGA